MVHFPVVSVRSHGVKDDDAIVLGQVVSSRSKPLDVKIVATEGENPYVIKLKHDRIRELKSDTNACSDIEWEHILSCTFLEDKPVDGVEALARVKSGESIEIMFTKKVSGIVTGRLGTLTLKCKEEQEISLFSWCMQLRRRQLKTRDEREREHESHTTHAARIEELEKLLEELRMSAKAAQDDLANAFAQILNEKKLRLRQQERLLSTAKVDPEKLSALQASRPKTRQRNAQKSRPAKRKASQEPKPESNDETSSEGFESMQDKGRKGNRRRYGSSSSSSSEEEVPIRAVRSVMTEGPSKQNDQSSVATHTRSKPSPFPEPSEELSSAPAQDGSETESGSDDELR